MRRLRRPRGDDGSMMLAMVITFMAVALIGMLLMTTMVGQEKSRQNQRYMTAVQGADAGVQQALVEISKLSPTATDTTVSGTTSIGGVNYTWQATRPAGSLSWSVSSSGTSANPVDGSTTRTVTAEIQQGSLFPLAAFGDERIAFNGNNGAVSYPVLGQGIVGSNGVLELKNNTVADGVMIFDWASDPDWDRCQNGPCSNAATRTSVDERLDIDTALQSGGFIKNQIDVCKASTPGGTLPAFVGTTIAARAEPYCFSSFHADTQNFTVTGNGVARIFVEGDVTLGNKNHSQVNYTSAQPDSIKLQIYTMGEDVGMYNQSNMAVALYAPNATCSGVTSNAGSDFYGSMICNVIDNVGGWTFHYDTRLGGIGNGRFNITEYNEP